MSVEFKNLSRFCFMVQKPAQNVKENTQIFEYIYENHPPDDVDISLSTVSKRDSVWDTQKRYRYRWRYIRIKRRI